MDKSWSTAYRAQAKIGRPLPTGDAASPVVNRAFGGLCPLNLPELCSGRSSAPFRGACSDAEDEIRTAFYEKAGKNARQPVLHPISLRSIGSDAEDEIRTRAPFQGPAFQAGALDRSATSAQPFSFRWDEKKKLGQKEKCLSQALAAEEEVAE